MLDWLQEVFGAYKLSDETFFLTVQLMDRYFSNINRKVPCDELHIIGMTCLFMASKYEEVIPLRLSTLVEKIGHSKYTNQQIKAKEREIF